MDPSDRSEEFVSAGLDSLGIEADEVDMAVIAAVHRVFWPQILDLLSLDTGEAELEPDLDLSRAPR